MRETAEQREARWMRERAAGIAPYDGKEDALSVLACLSVMSRQLDKEIGEQEQGVFYRIFDRWIAYPTSGTTKRILVDFHEGGVFVEEYWDMGNRVHGTEKYRLDALSDDRVLAAIPAPDWTKYQITSY